MSWVTSKIKGQKKHNTHTHTHRERERDRQTDSKKQDQDAAKLLAELERTEAPRRREHSMAFFQSIQNSWGMEKTSNQKKKKKK